MNEIEEFRAGARAKGVPDDIAELWVRLARPRLELSKDGDGPVVGQFGGRPALPEGTAWPQEMAFIASIDFAAIPAGTLDFDLPAGGTLLFFAEQDMDGYTIVKYVPAGTPVTEAVPPRDDLVYERFALHSAPHWNFPETRGDSAVDIGVISPEHERLVEDIPWDFDTYSCTIALGGYWTGNTGGGGNPIRSPADQEMLAQLYLSDDLVGKDFQTDMLIVYAVIAREDLSAWRFDRMEFSADFHG